MTSLSEFCCIHLIIQYISCHFVLQFPSSTTMRCQSHSQLVLTAGYICAMYSNLQVLPKSSEILPPTHHPLHMFRHSNHLQFTMLSSILKMISPRHLLLLFVLLPHQSLRFPHFRRRKTDSLPSIRTEKQWIQPELMALSVERTSSKQRENLKLEPRKI